MILLQELQVESSRNENESHNWFILITTQSLQQLMRPIQFRRFVVMALLLPTAVISCSTPPAPPSAQESGSSAVTQQPALKVMTTFLPMYLFTKAVAGDVAQVEILIQPGTEVHDYQSTPENAKALAQADVLVKNGLGLESFLDQTLKSVENPQLKVIDASTGMTPLTEETTPIVSLAPADDHKHHDGNPHIWLDPALAIQQVTAIRDGLITADPAHRSTYQANAAAYIEKLQQLDAKFKRSLQPFRDRTFVTFHDAFPYLAQRYQLKQVAIVEIPEDQLAPSDIQQVITTVQQFKVKAILSEPGVDNKLVTTLAKDLNLQVYPLDSLEAGDLEPQYYITAMEKNLSTLEQAFK